MPEPEVFNWIPHEGTETTREPSAIAVKFGDGHKQRRAGGLDTDLKTFKPVFRVTDEYSRVALDSPLSRHTGMRAFLWRLPEYSRAVRIACREWSISDNAMYTDSSCTFEEVTH